MKIGLVFLVLATTQVVSSRIHISLSLISYSNPKGVKSDSTCCDLGQDCFINPCDTKISGCLKSSLNTIHCDVGQFATHEFIDQNNITFGSKLSQTLTNPVIFQYEGPWDGRLFVELKAQDLDRGDVLELIDIYKSILAITPAHQHDNTKSKFETVYGNVSMLTYSINTYCGDNYYGTSCEKYCKVDPKRYTCNSNGEKVCNMNWYGSDCSVFCQQQNNGQNGFYKCGKDGEKICSKDWYGIDCKTYCINGTNYRCNLSGQKICDQYWYGQNCDQYCNALPNSHFKCDVTTGRKICDPSWYGYNCNTFCESKTDSQFTCDKSTGLKKCFDGYYGLDCDTFCRSHKADNYTCNQVGEKVCKEYFHGKDCDIYVPTLPNQPGICSLFGPSTIKTFDSKYYSFVGECQYKLAGDCKEDTFSVHYRQRCETFSNCQRDVTLYTNGLEVNLFHFDRVEMNKEKISLPFSSPNIVIEKLKGTDYLSINGMKGLTVLWNGRNIDIKLLPSFANKTCGLCGNFNGAPKDDFIIKGDILQSSDDFAKYWKKLDFGEKCPKRQPVMSENEYLLPNQVNDDDGTNAQILRLCNDFRNYPDLSVCRTVVPVQPYFDMCMKECQTAQKNCSCNSYKEFAKACLDQHAVMWKVPKPCANTRCPGGKTYQICNKNCIKTCKDMNKKMTCTLPKCMSGCFCPEGTVLNEDQCVPVSDCPCVHNKKEYQKGEKIRKDCNECVCSHGKWNCTTNQCPATCSVFGDPHYKTFDGRWYTFNGLCKYMLASDCTGNTFNITTQNVPCNAFSDVSCARSTTINLSNRTIVLGQGGRVMVDNTVVMLPYIRQGILIRQVSSSFIKMSSSIGLDVMFDGKTTIYVTVSPDFFDSTCGLCGTFNNKQQDDFTTPEGNIDSTALSFGNSWSVSSPCQRATHSVDPCVVQKQKATAADKKCKKLEMAPFTQCHRFVDPQPFIEACKYDVCGCQHGVECLCNAIAAYTKECSSKSVVIEWRNANVLPECAAMCVPGLVYQECGNICHRSCRDLTHEENCQSQCVAGCNCPNGTVLNDYNSCVPVNDCPCQWDGNSYPSGQIIYKDKNHCEKCTCIRGRFNCTVDTKNCKQQLKCPGNQIWLPGGSQCLRTCQSMHLPCLNQKVTGGCQCANGTVWDEDRRQCVLNIDCPCHHNGRTYADGESYRWDCNTCTCKGNMWDCTANVCPGTCSAYGDPHYTTFDGKRFLFEGRCKYTVAEDRCGSLNNNGLFSVVMENILCGSTGSVCTKAVTFTVNDTTITLRKDQAMTIMPSLAFMQSTPITKFEVIKSTFYDIIHTELGITLMWDRHTRVMISLQQQFKGKTCGLCGNFNDDQSDDFTTPEGDVVINTQELGDSWKMDTNCPDTKPLPHPCTVRKDRAPWSFKRCNILNQPLFQSCHMVVDPRPYFDACYHDTCGCDMGGDSHCLCTSVAAYAQACSSYGVHIKWRSQEFCPIQCEQCEVYKACGPSNPRTCQNLCQPTLETLPVNCVEGCFCANDTVLHNGKCIKPSECPCYLNGLVYEPGSYIVRDCQPCTCNNGCFECTGQTCTTTSAPTTSTRPNTQQTTSSTTQTTTARTTRQTTKVPTTADSTTTSQQTTAKPSTTANLTSRPSTNTTTTKQSTTDATTQAFTTTTTSQQTTSAPATTKYKTRPTTTTTGSATTTTDSTTTTSSSTTPGSTSTRPTTATTSQTTHKPYSTTRATSSTTRSTSTTSRATTYPPTTVKRTTKRPSTTQTTDSSTTQRVTTTDPKTTQPQPTTSQSSTTRQTTTQGTTKSPFNCTQTPRRFPCKDQSACLNNTQVCDGRSDCQDGSDEQGCPSNCGKCSKMDFRCHKTCQCVSWYFVCDNDRECTDGSDEIGCPVTNTTHPTTTQQTTTSQTTSKQTTETTSTRRTTLTTNKPTTMTQSSTTTTQQTTTPRVTTYPPTELPPMKCLNNHIYKTCTKTCTQKCAYLTFNCVEDSRTCSPGCGCPNNLLSNGTFCVLPSECSCFDYNTGRFARPNEQWQKGCVKNTCFNNGIVKSPVQCPSAPCPPPRRLVQKPGECCKKCIYGPAPTTAVPATTTPLICRAGFVSCGDKTCISKEWVCDGERDCADASDELNCPSKNTECYDAIGITYRQIIPDSSLTASSMWTPYHHPKFARYNLPSTMYSVGSWCARKNDPNKWIQVDLGKRYLVSKVMMQGRHMVANFIQSYKVMYKDENNAWRYYTLSGASAPKIFKGNTAPNQKTLSKLEYKIQARFIKLFPERFYSNACLRFELYGCVNETEPTTTTAPTTTTIPTTTTQPTTTPTICPEFRCGNGSCIPNLWVCDGKQQCSDGGDENVCNGNCSADQFHCRSGYCLPKQFRCDQDNDCFHGDDEMHCDNTTCNIFQFRCNNGSCIHLSQKCDGRVDCSTGEDEKSCPTTTTSPATTTTPRTTTTTTARPVCNGFKCRYGGKCLSNDLICDGTRDCGGWGEDEECCNTKTQYRCSHRPGAHVGKCIQASRRCDGYNDCGDSSDEFNCTQTTTGPATTTRYSTNIFTEPTATTKHGGQGGGTTTRGCPRNSTCLCENTCDSLAEKPDGCLSFYCIDDCSCPTGFTYDNVTKRCERDLDCPCVRNGTIYKTGSVLDGGNCTKCICTQNGFKCAKICPIKSCGLGEQMVYPKDDCCYCEKKISCRKDQYLTDCSCERNCTSNLTTCDPDTCSIGCACPDGTFDNGTNCIQKEKCYCVDEDGVKRKPNSRWGSGDCDSCKCTNGKIKCGKVCNHITCPPNFELFTPPDGCCMCMPKKTTAPPSVSTTTTTTTKSTTQSTRPTSQSTAQSTRPNTYSTKHSTLFTTSTTLQQTTSSPTTTPSQPNNCTKTEEIETYTDKHQCSGQVTKTYCQGGCLSTIISDFILGIGIQKCTCCKPIGIFNTTISLQCQNGNSKIFTYQRFRSCSCQPCDNSPFDDVTLFNP